MCIIISSNNKFEPSNDTSSNGQFDKKHGRIEGNMASAIRLRSPLMEYIPTVNVHQVQTATSSSNNHQQPSTRTPERSRLQLAVYHHQPEYTYKTYVVVYDANQGDGQPSYASSRNNNIYNTNIKKNQEPHRKARRRIPRLPHPMKTIKNNLHHRT